MAQRTKCPFPHDSIDGSPNLRVSLLIPSPAPRPLLDLLGVNDQELQEQMAKSHPYAFNSLKQVRSLIMLNCIVLFNFKGALAADNGGLCGRIGCDLGFS